MAFLGACGGLIMPVYGRYSTDDNMNYTRTGGHVLTLTDLSGRFGQFEPKTIGWRDPARYGGEGENKFTQSAFDTDTYTLTGTTAKFDGKVKYLERVNGLGMNTFLDGFFAVVPKAGTTVFSADTAVLANMASNWPLPFGGGDAPAAGPAADGRLWVVPPAVHGPTVAPPTARHDDPAPVAVASSAEADDADDLHALCGGVAVDRHDRVAFDAEW